MSGVYPSFRAGGVRVIAGDPNAAESDGDSKATRLTVDAASAAAPALLTRREASASPRASRALRNCVSGAGGSLASATMPALRSIDAGSHSAKPGQNDMYAQ